VSRRGGERARASPAAAGALAVVVAACGARGSPAGPGDPPRAAPAPAEAGAAAGDPGLVPLAYQLELAIDPDAHGYRGTVRVEVALSAPTRTIWLDGEDLAITEARVTADGAAVAAHPAADPPPGRVGVSLAQAIGPGAATLELGFTADYRHDDGIFVQDAGGRRYVFSDLEPIDARRAFPCFDEPRWKTPWTVSLIVPARMTALANAPALATTPVGRGRVRVDFAPTPPLPTYLVAIAVGPFELVEAAGGPIPARIVTPAGRAADAARAAAFTPELLAAAVALLDRPVPFAKLDIVAVPRFAGAMENPGLVTVAADLLLAPADDRAERTLALVLAHEIAHLWFGDSVTLGDWRDLWLNEGFASWMADELLARWRPAWATRRDEVRARREAMADDDAPGAHPLRPPVLANPRALFDRLTYQKSAALLHMIEAWVGEASFLDALRGYLDRHAGGTATTADALAALAPLGAEVAEVLEGLLTTRGVAHLEAELTCRGDARLHLRRRARAGDPGEDVRVPACVRWHDGRQARRACTLVGEAATLPLGDRCPTWIHPNAGATGYYRWSLRGAPLAPLVAAGAGDDAERIDAAQAIRTGLASGLPLPEIAAALAAAAAAELPEVVELAVADYRALHDDLVPPAARRAVAAHLGAALAPTVRRLGTTPRPGEPDDDRRLRPIALGAAGGLAGDPRVIAWARRETDRWLAAQARPASRPGGERPPRELVAAALAIAAAHADDRLAARLRQVAGDSLGRDPAALAARSLGHLPRARALAALDAALAGELPTPATFRLAVHLLGRRDTGRDTAAALARHGDWLGLALASASLCDPEVFDRLAAGAGAGDDALAGALSRRRAEAARCDALRPPAAGAGRAFAR
jgi:cytosol alanyl aminopeptidase